MYHGDGTRDARFNGRFLPAPQSEWDCGNGGVGRDKTEERLHTYLAHHQRWVALYRSIEHHRCHCPQARIVANNNWQRHIKACHSRTGLQPTDCRQWRHPTRRTAMGRRTWYWDWRQSGRQYWNTERSSKSDVRLGCDGWSHRVQQRTDCSTRRSSRKFFQRISDQQRTFGLFATSGWQSERFGMEPPL